jgi:hypothetical protein
MKEIGRPEVASRIALSCIFKKLFGKFHALGLLICLIGICSLVLALPGIGQAEHTRCRPCLSGQSEKRAPGGATASIHADLGEKAQVAVRRLFGGGVKPATDYKPYFLTGDFNGDRLKDLLVLVRVQNTRSGMPQEVRVLNPWGYETQNSSDTALLALAIIHGSSENWETQTPAGRFLLTDRDFFSTPIWESGTQNNLLSVIRKSSLKAKRRGNARSRGKGDAIGLATEAGVDEILYWDGQTYRLEAPQEEP